MGYDISLRRNDAALIEVVSEAEFAAAQAESKEQSRTADSYIITDNDDIQTMAFHKGHTINVALVGNPNCGKTSLFNYVCGTHERVGNYSGVTVDAKEGTFHHKGYTFNIVDLPGTYSLSAYTPEELYVRHHLNEEQPDVVLNILDASNLERNLYLTTQLIDMDMRMVIALNIYDELEKRGDKFDHESLGRMIGAPIVPTISKTGMGVEALFDRIIQVYEEQDPIVRHIHINYGDILEKAIEHLHRAFPDHNEMGRSIPHRYLSIKLWEGDPEVSRNVEALPNGQQILQIRDKEVAQIESLMETDSETAFTDARYGFISGALRETYQQNKIKDVTATQVIDLFVTHKILGFPIFLFFMWAMFETTFQLGSYPMEWIEWLVDAISSFCRSQLPEGALKDLIVDGIIAGVGGVIVFLPNIVILYAFISFMEDSGYMARAAFIMDRIMHKMGLHGKSFIPLVMGFGCNVPAVMATRTIESRNSRMITMLITPLMSCSARLPVYVLLTGVFFPQNSSMVLLCIYTFGILLSVLMARLFKRFLFNQEEVPFVMELPPYRMPTGRSILIHMWERSKQYLQKMGGIILIASVIIWFLGYFPRGSETSTTLEQQQNSYIGQIGQAIEPVMAPLGFDWKISISLLSGMAAKEIIISTLSVLYTGNEEEDGQALSARLQQDLYPDGSPVFTPLVALCLMLFTLIYFPCVATISAIVQESHSWKWGLFTVVYTCLVAWITTFLCYQIGHLFV